jgi:hypothetical protein
MPSAPWLTETIRFSAFGEALVPGSSLLSDIFGVQPEDVNERPAQSFRQEAARYGHCRIIVTRSPQRLDLIFADLADANTSDPTRSNYKPFFDIGDYDDVFESVRPRVHDLVGKLQNPTRLAYAPILFAPAQTPIEAYRLLAEKLTQLHFDPDTDTDVLWQINRPRMSRTGPIRLNRVSKWHAIVQHLQIIPPISRVPQRYDAAAARVEIDINTPADNPRALADIDIMSITDELVLLAREILDKGDIP